MKARLLRSLTLIAAAVLSIDMGIAYAQNVKPSAPEGYAPGLIARAYLGGDTNAKKYPTHCVAVVQSGKEFIDKYKPMVESQIRGKAHTNEVYYCAFGYIVVEKETDVKFDVGEGTCFVNDKEFGTKTFTHQFKAGKHAVEITRRWGHGQGDFHIVDAASGQPVIFHTEQMLKRELGRSFKIGGRTLKTTDLNQILDRKD